MKTKIINTLNDSTKVHVDSKDSTESIFAGYKGVVEKDTAMYFVPYIPLTISSATVIPPWEDLLNTLHINHLLYPSKKKNSQDHIMDAIAVMQERYPGDYNIEEQFDPVKKKFTYVMVFANQEDKTMFVLKYS